MTTPQAVLILLQSNFQVTLFDERVKVDFVPFTHSEEIIREAMAHLNTEAGFNFIRKLDEDTKPIF